MKIRNFYTIIAIIISFFLGMAVNSFADNVLQKMSRDIIEIVQKVNPAVVEVTAISKIDILDADGKPIQEFLELFEKMPDKNFPKRYNQKNIGSGIIIDKKGHVVTTVSVIHNAHDIRILLADGRKFKAKLVGTDDETDIAVLLIKANDLPIVPLGNSDEVISGALVVAVGRSYGHAPTYAFGITSGIESLPGEPVCDLMKLNLRFSPGNSGGAVVNTSGELIGIILAMLAETEIGNFPTQFAKPRLKHAKARQTPKVLNVSETSKSNLSQTSIDGDIFREQTTSFAIPIDTVNKIAKELIAHGKIRRGWLGVWIEQQLSETEMPTGVEIIQFAGNSPAAQAGLKLNDIVIAFNGKPIRTTHDLKRFIANSQPDANVKLNILRKGKELFFNVKLGEKKR
jgi:S1-C subfamily serine protease